MSSTRHRFAILGAAAFFSTGGAAIKACGLNGWQVACFRSGIAAVALAIALPKARRGWSWGTLLVSLAYATTMVLFVQANKLTTAANTIFLQSAAPLYILLLGPLLLKERIRRSDLVLMGVIVAGLGLFFVDLSSDAPTAPNPFLGNVLATGAGLSYALLLLGLRWLERRGTSQGGGLTAVLAGNTLACLVLLPLALPVHGAVTVDWAVLGYLGIVQISLSYLLLTYGLGHVPAFEASLLILAEPTLSPLWAWLFTGETPGGWSLAGGALILGATTFKTWLDQRSVKAPPAP